MTKEPKAATQDEAIHAAALEFASNGIGELLSMLAEAAALTNSGDPKEAASGWERIRLLAAIKGAIEAGAYTDVADIDKRLTAIEKAKVAKPATVDMKPIIDAIAALDKRLAAVEAAKG